MTADQLKLLPVGSLILVGVASRFVVEHHIGKFIFLIEDVLGWLPEDMRREHLGLRRYGPRHFAYTDLELISVRRLGRTLPASVG
jgi:hypothetical protein